MNKHVRAIGKSFASVALIISLTAVPMLASSHAEAPLISMDRYADNTEWWKDFCRSAR
ncbi:hypothetical protein BH20ACI2_BH20ACI2_13360 [soil metagenome]